MKKKQLLILTFIFTIVFVISIAVIYIGLNPAFTKVYNLTNCSTANIGTTLSYIITPFFIAVSSILIFYALIKQIESNKDQRLKTDGDMIFLLLNQLDLEIENIQFEDTSEDGQKQTLSGNYALFRLLRSVYFNNENTPEKFFKTLDGYKLLLLIRSFNLIERRIERSNLHEEDNEVFYYKLYDFYKHKMSRSLRFLIKNNELRHQTNVESVKFLVDFYDKCNEKVEKYVGIS